MLIHPSVPPVFFKARSLVKMDEKQLKGMTEEEHLFMANYVFCKKNMCKQFIEFGATTF